MTAVDNIEAKAARLRILVVDDNRDVADSLGALLRLWGFDVRVAYDGSEALTSAYAYHPDCLLSDIDMPGIDGYDLARWVHRDKELNSILLVAVTASSDEARAKAAGFDHHFVKPADLRDLESLLTQPRAREKHLDHTVELLPL